MKPQTIACGVPEKAGGDAGHEPAPVGRHARSYDLKGKCRDEKENQ